MRSRLLVCSLTLALSASAGAQTLAQRVDPWVLEKASRGEADFLVMLRGQADLRGARFLAARTEKAAFVADALRAHAAATQAPLLRFLDERGAPHRAFWVANMIQVRGDRALVEALAAREDVFHVYANPRVRFDGPVAQHPAADLPDTPDGIEWNVARIHAPDVWALGLTGQGVVIGGQDTGYEWDHPALKNHYRGWNGLAADHDYNWHDAIHSGGGNCGADAAAPCDDSAHGTHTMGTMVGDDGGSNQTGVAPGAKWIGCRNMDQGAGTPATYSECFEWFIAPTDLQNANPDPAMAPNVISNSWSCPPSEGCTDPAVLQTVVENTRAAGIEVVVSAGNAGSSCSTVSDPAAIYDASFSVGATDSNDQIAGFSSRGPVTADGSNRLKPDVSAPGVGVRSSVPGGGYAVFNGTSMAGPHVAGLVALLLSANPGLAGDPDAIEAAITSTAVPRTTSQDCGGIPGTAIPNNTYGWGRVDALAALGAASIFTDVPPASLFYTAVNTLARNGITAGCAPGMFCPDEPVTRAQMAVLLLKSQFGPSHLPPPATGAVFADVAPSAFAADWIEELASLGVTGGCGGGNYCPAATVTRSQMAVFLLKTHLGSAYAPPAATGIFADVPVGSFADAWIEDLYARGITGGCSTAPLLYCPDDPNTRGQMAVFLVETFGLE